MWETTSLLFFSFIFLIIVTFSIFSYVYLSFFLGEMSSKTLHIYLIGIFFYYCWVVGILFILHVNSLFEMLFANICSILPVHFVDYVIWCTEGLIWCNPIYLYFVLFTVLLVSYERNPLEIQWHQSFYPSFPKSFIVLGFTLRSLMHFELIFLYGVK